MGKDEGSVLISQATCSLTPGFKMVWGALGHCVLSIEQSPRRHGPRGPPWLPGQSLSPREEAPFLSSRYSGACGGCFTGLHRSRNSQNTFPLLCVTPAVRGCFAQGTLLAAITDQPGLTAELCAMMVRDPHVRSDLA